MWTFFMLSLPGSEDHSTSGNRLLPGIVIDDKEGHHYLLLYTILPFVEWIILCKKSPCQSFQSTAPGEGGAARARAPCLHRAHRCLLCQPGRSDSKQCSKMFASPGPTQAWVQEHILGERVHGTTGIKNVISMYQQIIITIIVILMVII